jgi:diguanylate cyclase (GGDEF)-like protein
VSLRAKLTVAFVLVLALPLLAVMLLVRGAVSTEVRERGAAELGAAHDAAPVVYRALQARAGDAVRRVAGEIGPGANPFADRASAARFTASERGSLGFLAAVAGDGSVVGFSAATPDLLPGAAPVDPAQVIRDRDASRAAIAEAVVAGTGGSPGSLVGGYWLDASFTAALPAGREALLLVDGTAVASTDRAITGAFRPALHADGDLLAGRIGGREVVGVRGGVVGGLAAARLSVLAYGLRSDVLAASGSITIAMWVVILAAVAIGCAIAWWLARAVTRPLAEMSEAARAIARGNVAGTIQVGSPDEVGAIAAAFNEVFGNMQGRLAELEESRDQVRRSVERLGEVLRSTHDLSKLLSVVLEIATSTVQARAGAIYLLAPSRMELSLKVSRALGDALAEHRPRVGEGIVGSVAETRRSILIPSASESPSPSPAQWEPREPTVLAVPIESETALLGVIVLYGRTVPRAFDTYDLETVRSLARQAAVGVENVLLHQEAQRLSITDGLTSLWNYRFMNMRLGQEVERAIRFTRPLSVLVIDIDHFKSINDRHGHQRGDAILAELANRIVRETRGQVDTVARYGGEEFVLILPETPIEGGGVVAEKIRSSIAGTSFGGEQEVALDVTASIGLACFPQHGSTAQTLLRAADQALYEAKARGRNCIVSADELDRGSPVADDSDRP